MADNNSSEMLEEMPERMAYEAIVVGTGEKIRVRVPWDANVSNDWPPVKPVPEEKSCCII